MATCRCILKDMHITNLMLWQLGTETVRKFGLASLLNCFSGDTEILTETGVNTLENLYKYKSTRVMTSLGKWVDAEIKSFGEQRLYKILLSKGKAQKVVHATKEHRWFRRAYRNGIERDNSSNKEVITSDLKPGDKLVSTYGQSIKGIKYISRYGIAHGLVFGDGSVSNNVASIRLCGEKNKQLIEYFDSSIVYDYEGDKIVSGLPKYFKNAPELDMDKPYLYGWLSGYFAADGSVREEGQIRLSSANINNLKLARDVCIKLGIGYSSISVQNRIGIGQEVPSDLFTLNVNGSDLTEEFFLIDEHRRRFVNHSYKDKLDWSVVEVTETDRVETVYCAVVPDTHTFVLEGNILTGNCWYVSMRDVDDFCFVFEHLMLGGGVGFSVKREDIHQLPKVKSKITVTHENTKDADFIVPDSRQGWVELLRRTLASYFSSGKSFTYSTILVRAAGEPIKGFGGTASGPRILVEGITKICAVLNSRSGKKLRSIDVLDINNIIGSVVVAGNVRRSAEIAIGDPDDYLFLRAKRWDLSNIPNWRAMSNNSIYADNYDQLNSVDVWDGYKGNGEPIGFMNLPLAKTRGRLNDLMDDNCEGMNPCGEVTLADGEACNLCEIFLNNIDTYEQFIDCAELLYKTQKAIWKLPTQYDKTAKIVAKNMRIGLGVGGICQSLDKLDWLDRAYGRLRSFDKKWSASKGYPESIKLTTIKPSGTISLLAGATPGAHPAYAQFYIRRVRMQASDSLVEICKERGYRVEFVKFFDGAIDRNTVIVEFPCMVNENTLISRNMTAIDQLELVKKLMTVWADNSVSITVYYRKEELDDIREWLKQNYENNIKSVSFLLHDDHGFNQAPYEEISEMDYNLTVANLKDVEKVFTPEYEMLMLDECATGACPVR